MKRKFLFAVFGLGLAHAVTAAPAVAAQSHLSEAIGHAREAVASGREGKPSGLVRHATNALDHAIEAQRERPDPHVKKAISRLREAIKFGKANRRAATTVADRALQELERAPQ
jgi:LPS O-antigen subunit length determinant protein (WzzB/FepE family)